MEFEYYHIEKSAKMLSNLVGSEYSKDELITLGSAGKLSIYILTGKYYVTGDHVNQSGIVSTGHVCYGCRYKKLFYGCLRELEAGNEFAEVILEPVPFYAEIVGPMPYYRLDDYGRWQNGEIRYSLRHKNILYPSVSELILANKKGEMTNEVLMSTLTKIADSLPPNILIKDCEMIVLADDLNTLANDINKFKNATVNEVREFTDSEREKLLKHVALLALSLAEKSKKYKYGDKPNASQIANDVQLIIDSSNFEETKGTGTSEIRDSISKGLELLR